MSTFEQIKKVVNTSISAHNADIEEKRRVMQEAGELAAASRAEADVAFTSDMPPIEAAALEVTAKRNERLLSLAKAEYEKAAKSNAFTVADYDRLIREAVKSRRNDAAKAGEELCLAIQDVEAATDNLKRIDTDLAELAELMRRNAGMKDFSSTPYYGFRYGHYCAGSIQKAVKEITGIFKSRIEPNILHDE